MSEAGQILYTSSAGSGNLLGDTVIETVDSDGTPAADYASGTVVYHDEVGGYMRVLLDDPAKKFRVGNYAFNGDWDGPWDTVSDFTRETLQQGVSPSAAYDGCSGAVLIAAGAGNSYAPTSCWAGRHATSALLYRPLLRFDLSEVATGIPADATVVGATLTLTYIAETNATDADHFLYQMLKAWANVAADHAPASAGEPSWNDQASPTDWTAAGAGGEGSDREATAFADATVTAAANTEIPFSGENLIAVVQGWIDGTINNYGLLVKGAESDNNQTKQFAGHLHATAAYRPELTVEWTGGEPPAGGGTKPLLLHRRRRG
jgi:hypothetical protein